MTRDALKVRPSPYAHQLTNNPGKPREVIGLDTETSVGYATLITDSDGNYTDFSTFQNPDDGNADKLFEWLTRKRYRSTLNFFFNGTFDWNAIIKWMPEKEERTTLIRTGAVDYRGYRFQYIVDKILKIGRLTKDPKDPERLKVKHSCRYWDINQFLTGESLAVQSRNTPVPKDESFDIGVGIDKERYKSDKEYRQNVIKYCIRDSRATQYLAQRFVNQVYDMGVYPSTWHSKASIAKLYLRYNLKSQIKLPKGIIQQHALNCTRGGLIDCHQMGVFKNVKSPDVRSCYPYIIQSLYSYHGKTSRDLEYLPDAAYSWFKVRVDYSHPYASLLWYPQVTPEKKDLKEHWHITGDMEVWITKPEYEYISKLGYDLKILEASHVLKSPNTGQPYFNIMNDLWDMRMEAKASDDSAKKAMQAVHKIVSNSMYGMMLNSWDELTFHTEAEAIEAMKKEGYETDGFEEFMKSRNATRFIRKENGIKTMGCHTHTQQAGTFYAPFMASHILAGARVKLCSDMQRDIDKGHVISVATDSFSLTKLSSKLDTSQKLGAWDIATYDELLQFGAGRYLVSKDGEIDPEASGKRSIPLPPEKILGLLHEYRGEESIPFYKSSPVQAKESISPHYAGQDMLDVFVDKHKELRLLTTKRHWYEKYNKVGDIFEYNINSRPFDISEMKQCKVI